MSMNLKENVAVGREVDPLEENVIDREADLLKENVVDHEADLLQFAEDLRLVPHMIQIPCRVVIKLRGVPLVLPVLLV